MRCAKVGLIFLMLWPALVAAQVSGDVESIGFDNYIRPDAWIPMVIRLRPESTQTETYQIRVRVQDMDRDQPIAMREITLTGTAEGQSRDQRFRMYFPPPPTNRGLPDTTDPGALQELQEKLKVSLHHARSGDWVADLPITTTVRNVDPDRGGYEQGRGSKLIIAVTEGSSRVIYRDLNVNIAGLLEDVEIVNVQPRDLPESVLGYDAVDGIIWLDADPASLKSGGDEKYNAIDQYLRRGGKLVICQPFDWQKILAFEEMLPVQVTGVETKDTLTEFHDLITPRGERDPREFVDKKAPPYRFARAKAKPQSIVVSQIEWKAKTDESPADTSPYMVRMPWGLGCITWVAQDLGDNSLPRPPYPWVYAWEKVFDWKNNPRVITEQTSAADRRLYDRAPAMDIGKSLIERWLDLQSKSAWLITLAGLFFLGYWLIAGPGSYTYLATRRKTHLSWFVFGLCGLLATGLTVLITRLVLRGPPEVKHFSVVRVAPQQPAFITSRLGLYIPRDGDQRIALKDYAPGTVNTITPLMIHPAFVRDVPEQLGPEFDLPIPDAASREAPAISVPYRSTLKKFQATWNGPMAAAIQGSGKLMARDLIEGKLTNGTGVELRNVYIAFHYPSGSAATEGDWIYFWRRWPAGVTIDLARDYQMNDDGSRRLFFNFEPRDAGSLNKFRGRITQDWMPYWTQGLYGNVMQNTFDDSGQLMRRSLPMMSFFDRLSPMRNDPAEQRENRLELLRRGGRWLDVSAALSAGQLVVIAEAEGPLPIPLEVEGDRVTGEGLILYQFVLPLDHSADLTQVTEE